MNCPRTDPTTQCPSCPTAPDEPCPLAEPVDLGGAPITAGPGMNEMIERIARLWLLEPTGRMEDNFPLNMRFDSLDQFLNCIRSSIEAMREPTEAMLIGARDWSGAKYGKSIGNDAATGCHHAMIDAALTEPATGERERGGVGS